MSDDLMDMLDAAAFCADHTEWQAAIRSAIDEIVRLRAALDAIDELPSPLHDDDSQSLVEAVDPYTTSDTPNRAAETLPNVQEPNPYRFTVKRGATFGGIGLYVYCNGISVGMVAKGRTKEEADTHAALILAALHQAVIE